MRNRLSWIICHKTNIRKVVVRDPYTGSLERVRTETYMIRPARGHPGLNPEKWEREDDLCSNSHPLPPQLESPTVIALVMQPASPTMDVEQVTVEFMHILFKPQMASMNTSYSTPSSQRLLQHQGKCHWKNSNGNQNRESLSDELKDSSL